jgi:NADH dehydrogenase
VNVLLSVRNELLERSMAEALIGVGHQVRVVSARTSDRPTEPVAEPIDRRLVDGSDPSATREAIVGCDAAIIVHHSVTSSTSAVTDAAPDPTVQMIEAAGQGGVRRLILVSSRDDGEDATAAESRARTDKAIRRFPGEWIHLRSATVYGIADDPITLFLIMMRTLPAVPIVSDAHVVQPLWHQDLAQAAVAALSLAPAALDRIVELAGPDTVTQAQLYDRIAALTDRRPVRIPVPEFIAAHGGRLAEALRLIAPSELSQHLAFGGSEEPLAPVDNALSHILGVTPASLEHGLRRLVTDLPEVTPSEGVGSLEVKRFAATISGSRYDAIGLLREFRARFKEMMPIEIGVEPASPLTKLEEGGVITMALPGRGHVQVRVEEVGDHHVVVGTLRGHVVAGIVRFSARQHEDRLTFEVMTCDTAANAFDWLTLTLGGGRIQDANWARVVQNVVTLSGGTADAIASDGGKLTDEEARVVQQSIQAIIEKQRAAQSIGGASR